MDGYRWGEVKLHGGLHVGFVTGGDLDAVELRVTQLRGVSFKAVSAGLERGEAVNAIFGGDGADLFVCRLIAKDDGCASERIRVEISEFASKGAAGLGADWDLRAQKEYGNREQLHPVTSFTSHLDT